MTKTMSPITLIIMIVYLATETTPTGFNGHRVVPYSYDRAVLWAAVNAAYLS